MLGKKALTRLKYLDFSFNKLDQKSLRRIKLLSIEDLVLGESDFSIALCDETLGSGFIRMPCPRIRKIQTTGFASTLLSRWKERPKPAKSALSPTNLPGGRNFYSGLKLPQSELAVGGKSDQSLGNKIMYHKKHSLGNITNAPRPLAKWVPPKKRKLSNLEVCDNILF